MAAAPHHTEALGMPIAAGKLFSATGFKPPMAAHSFSNSCVVGRTSEKKRKASPRQPGGRWGGIGSHTRAGTRAAGYFWQKSEMAPTASCLQRRLSAVARWSLSLCVRAAVPPRPRRDSLQDLLGLGLLLLFRLLRAGARRSRKEENGAPAKAPPGGLLQTHGRGHEGLQVPGHLAEVLLQSPSRRNHPRQHHHHAMRIIPEREGRKNRLCCFTVVNPPRRLCTRSLCVLIR